MILIVDISACIGLYSWIKQQKNEKGSLNMVFGHLNQVKMKSLQKLTKKKPEFEENKHFTFEHQGITSANVNSGELSSPSIASNPLSISVCVCVFTELVSHSVTYTHRFLNLILCVWEKVLREREREVFSTVRLVQLC